MNKKVCEIKVKAAYICKSHPAFLACTLFGAECVDHYLYLNTNHKMLVDTKVAWSTFVSLRQNEVINTLHVCTKYTVWQCTCAFYVILRSELTAVACWHSTVPVLHLLVMNADVT